MESESEEILKRRNI